MNETHIIIIICSFVTVIDRNTIKGGIENRSTLKVSWKSKPKLIPRFKTGLPCWWDEGGKGLFPKTLMS